MHRRWMRMVCAVFALSLLAAACGGDEPNAGGNGNGGGGNGDGGGGAADLTIVDFAFEPTELSVSEGDTITVSNVGATSHSFTTDDGVIDETISEGQTVEITLDGVASGGFHCKFHSQMTGTLTVA